MRRIASYLLLFVHALCCGLASAADSRTAFIFPIELAGFQRGEQVDFESRHPGLGIGVPYAAPGVKVTVFVYNLRLEKLPEGPDSSVIRAQFRQARGDVDNSYSNVKTLIDETRGNGHCSSFLRTQLSFDDPHRAHASSLSHLYMGTRRGNFIKVRITYSAAEDVASNETAQENFAQALCKLVSE